ncbi:type II and III secretion system protein family protein [Vibrio comitans]|uniref:General secretion pathway protein GspD n=1 Tax=Vibrio comitans NBRC 102076 TaxID=1219078 RepID=A0A4Y3IP74_9VIBR|nr:pilus assembly protein N-terminal domain-containing protein [Vibrio comitans]GEA60668.1 general secretion pathway protein GspD [Vibrio comitans NBRC 102076]
MRSIWSFITFFFAFLFSFAVFAAYDIPLNDARSIRTKQQIGTVFMSQPMIADYKVINERQIVVFGSSIGQTRLMIYDIDGRLILSRHVNIIQPLQHVRNEIKQRFPDLNISIQSIGSRVAINGIVYTEKQRDEIYAITAGILGFEKAARWELTDDMTEDLTAPFRVDPKTHFYRNYTYEGIIEGLELSFPFQVNVRTTIAQVGSDFNETIGVDWGSTGASPGVFTFPDLTATDLSAVITALSDESLAEVLAEPNLTVLSGEEASFLVGGEIPMIISDTNGTTIEFKEYGIGLDIAAKVMNENEIRLRVQPSVSVVDDIIRIESTEVPQLSSRRATTTIEIADGQTFMIGGLMSSEDIENLQKIPLLGDIPFFGALFSKSTTDRRSTEVVIIATVNLVKPTSASTLNIPRMNRTNTLERWMGMSGGFNQKDAQDAEFIDLLEVGGFAQ